MNEIISLIVSVVVFIGMVLVAYKVDEMLKDIRKSRELLARIADGIDALSKREQTPKAAPPKPPAVPKPAFRDQSPRRVIEIEDPSA